MTEIKMDQAKRDSLLVTAAGLAAIGKYEEAKTELFKSSGRTNESFENKIKAGKILDDLSRRAQDRISNNS